VSQRRFVSALRQAHSQRRDSNPPGIEHAHGIDKAVSLAAEASIVADAALLEQDLAGVARAHAELVFLLPSAQSWRAPVEDERRNPFRPGLPIGFLTCEQDSHD